MWVEEEREVSIDWASEGEVGFSRIWEEWETTVSAPIIRTGEVEREGGRVMEEAFEEAERVT